MQQTERASLPAITLGELARIIEKDGGSATVTGEASVRGMAIDSRAVEPSNLFVCKGAAFKPAYLASAAERGAAAYLCADDPALVGALAAAAPGVARISVGDVRRAMALVAPAIYDHPDRALEVVGITGTKGKSTVSYMLAAILAAAGVETSILGSIETDDGMQRFESHNTTPEAPDLWRHLRNTVDAGRRHMVMEVSSQGLKYDRVLGLNFDVACFLNIGRDHISSVEHPDFEDYFQSKLRIFEQCETAVVNLATDHVDRVLAAAHAGASRVVCFSARHLGSPELPAGLPAPDYVADNVTSEAGTLAFDVHEVGDDAPHRVKLGMMGLFNVDNALAAIAMARLLGVGYDAIGRGLAHVRVPGRMEIVSSPDGRVIAVVDYAHNELSFETLFSSVKHEYPTRRIIAVFGAPGGKAYERREALPRVAGKYADLIIYTEEDPAHDLVEDICADLVRNTPAGVAHEEIYDREQAIRYAIDDARAHEGESVVLLLAKGDETCQHRGDDYPEIKSDLAIARELLE